MVNPKRLVAMARRRRKLAATGRKRISMPRADAEACKKSAPSKGRFVVYTTDGRYHAVTLSHHNSPIFQEPFRMSEDEFGLPSDGPFDAAFMDYIVSLLQRAVPNDLERELIFSLAASRCSTSSSLHRPYTNPSIFVHG